MQMGIERVLKENFSNLGPIIDVTNLEEKQLLTLEAVQNALQPVSPAIKAMGGNLNVKSVNGEQGLVTLSFIGPSKLKTGIEAILKDLDLVKQIVYED